jgi:hypothetical protein
MESDPDASGYAAMWYRCGSFCAGCQEREVSARQGILEAGFQKKQRGYLNPRSFSFWPIKGKVTGQNLPRSTFFVVLYFLRPLLLFFIFFGGAFEVLDGLADSGADFRKLAGTENDENDHKDNYKFGHADSKHTASYVSGLGCLNSCSSLKNSLDFT